MARDRSYSPNAKRFFKKPIVTQDEVDAIRAMGRAATAFLEDEKFLPIRNYMLQAQQEILTMHAEQSIYDAQEEVAMGDRIKRIFFPAKKEYEMVAGEYRFVKRFLAHLDQSIKIANDLNDRIKSEEVEVRG